MSPRNVFALLAGAAVIAAPSACSPADEAEAASLTAEVSLPYVCSTEHRDVALPGGTFIMGAQPEGHDEGPAVEATVAAFSIDSTEVTNAQFAEFVDATGYVTVAEREPDPALYPGVPADQLKPAGIVFAGADQIGDGNPADWWRIIEGANWRHPEGPGSNIAQRLHHPVVQIGYEDALAYASWRGRDLPTEAEWEYAARSGINSARFEWGNDAPKEGEAPRANTWQGVFPAVDTGKDGYKARTAPVGCYAASAFGLYDMTGNVWEWTRDWLSDGRDPDDPQRQHLIKGGSFLCADNYCLRYRPSARQGGPTDTGSSHIGFRTVKRSTP